MTRYFCFLSLLFGVGFSSPLLALLVNRGDIPFGPLNFSIASLSLVLIASGILHYIFSRMTASDRPAVVALSVALVVGFQGNVVHELFDYGPLDGRLVNWGQWGLIFWVEWIGFLVAFPLCYRLLTRLKKIPAWLPILPVVSSFLLVAPNILTYEPIRTVPSEIIDPSVFDFSSELNLIHLLPDAFQVDIVSQVLESDQALARRLAGFTLYRGHMGMFQHTAPSVPSIFTGRPFDLEVGQDFTRFHQRSQASLEADGYTTTLIQNGFRVDSVSALPAYCIPAADTCAVRPFNDFKAWGYFGFGEKITGRALAFMIDLTLFRHSPTFLKEKIYNRGQWMVTNAIPDGSSPYPGPVLREWIANMAVADEQPRYKSYHYIGTHYPARWDQDCNLTGNRKLPIDDGGLVREEFVAQATCVLSGIASLADKLRDEGIFDQTAIIVSGDHGIPVEPDDLVGRVPDGINPLHIASARPALLIKPLQDSTPFRFSEAPTSLLDIAPTALQLVGLDGNYTGQRILTMDIDPERTRNFQYDNVSDFWTGQPITYENYEVTGSTRDPTNWRLSYRFSPDRGREVYERPDAPNSTQSEGFVDPDRPVVATGEAGAPIHFFDADQRVQRVSGWYPEERQGDQRWRWAGADPSVIEVWMASSDPVVMTFRGRAFEADNVPPQRIDVVVNGDAVAQRDILATEDTYSVEVPEGVFRAGSNTVEFLYRWARAPQRGGSSVDTRLFSVVWHSLSLSPQ